MTNCCSDGDLCGIVQGVNNLGVSLLASFKIVTVAKIVVLTLVFVRQINLFFKSLLDGFSLKIGQLIEGIYKVLMIVVT